jgi:hypothetical protein
MSSGEQAIVQKDDKKKSKTVGISLMVGGAVFACGLFIILIWRHNARKNSEKKEAIERAKARALISKQADDERRINEAEIKAKTQREEYLNQLKNQKESPPNQKDNQTNPPANKKDSPANQSELLVVQKSSQKTEPTKEPINIANSKNEPAKDCCKKQRKEMAKTPEPVKVQNSDLTRKPVKGQKDIKNNIHGDEIPKDNQKDTPSTQEKIDKKAESLVEYFQKTKKISPIADQLNRDSEKADNDMDIFSGMKISMPIGNMNYEMSISQLMGSLFRGNKHKHQCNTETSTEDKEVDIHHIENEQKSTANEQDDINDQQEVEAEEDEQVEKIEDEEQEDEQVEKIEDEGDEGEDDQDVEQEDDQNVEQEDDQDLEEEQEDEQEDGQEQEVDGEENEEIQEDKQEIEEVEKSDAVGDQHIDEPKVNIEELTTMNNNETGENELETEEVSNQETPETIKQKQPKKKNNRRKTHKNKHK